MRPFPTSSEVAVYAAVKAGHQDGVSIARITRVPIGSVYSVLARLEVQGVLVSEEERVARGIGRPAKRLYRVIAPLPGLERLLAVLVYGGLTP